VYSYFSIEVLRYESLMSAGAELHYRETPVVGSMAASTRYAVLSAAAMPRLVGFVTKMCAVQLQRVGGGGGFLGGGSFFSSGFGMAKALARDADKTGPTRERSSSEGERLELVEETVWQLGPLRRRCGG
jgi:hypothetical protein